FNPHGIETVIAGEMLPVRHPLNAGFGYVDGRKPLAKFVDAETSQPFACRSAVARPTDGIRSARLVTFVGAFFERFQAARPANLIRHRALVKIARRAAVILASNSVNGRRDSGQLPLTIDECFAFIPLPGSVLSSLP